MQAKPPETTEKRRLVSEARAPASTLPRLGALATWASSIPESRPRIESGVTVSKIVVRRMALQSSAAPARARKSSAGQRLGDKPKPTIAAPHTDAATQTPRLLADESKAFGDRPQAGPLDGPDRRQGRQQQRGNERRRERTNVDRVGSGQPRRCDQDSAHGRAADVAERRVDALNGCRRRDLVFADEPRNEGVHRGSLNRVERSAQRLCRIQRPDSWVRNGRIHDEQRRDRDQAEVGDDEQHPAIERVGDCAAEERHRQQRNQCGDPEQPDRERRSCQLEDLIRDRDRRQHAAEQRDRVPEPEAAEIARAAKRSEIDRHPPNEGETARALGFAGRVLYRGAEPISHADSGSDLFERVDRSFQTDAQAEPAHLTTAPQAAPTAAVIYSSASTGHFRGMRRQSPRILTTAPQAAPTAAGIDSSASTGHFRRMRRQSPRILTTAPQAAPAAARIDSSASTGHFRRMRRQSPRILTTAPQAAPAAAGIDSSASTGHFRRIRRQSPRVLRAAPRAAPFYEGGPAVK